MANTLSGHDIRRIAVMGHLDPRTVERSLRGETVRPMATHRLRAAAQACGLMHAFPHLESVVIGSVTDAPDAPEAK